MRSPSIHRATTAPAAPRIAIDTRLLAAVGMAASPLLLVESIRYGFGPSRMDFLTSLGGFVYMLGAMSSLVALRRFRASGDGAIATGLHALQLALTILAAGWSAAFLFTGPEGGSGSVLWRISDPAWPLTHLSMLALGARMAAAGRMRGWRRFPAFACGLALPSFFALVSLGVPRPVGAAIFGVLTTVGFFGMGLAAFTTLERS